MQAGPQFRAPFDLDASLIHFSKKDAFTLRDAFEGVQIFGAIGSGKTSGSGAALARAYLRAGFSGLVLCAKPEERALWEHYATSTGRSRDLLIIGKDAKYRLNFLDYELRRKGEGAGLTENLVNLISNIVEIAEGRADHSSDDRFWERAMKELLRNAIDLIGIAKGTITLEDITRLITDAPQTPEQVEDDAWKATSSCWQLVTEAAARTDKTARQAHDLDTAARYWFAEFPRLSDRTRGNIVATLTGVLDTIQHGLAWELFGTTTTIVPEVAYKAGAILVCDFSVQEYGPQGRIIQGIFKLLFQRAILRRNTATDPRPLFLWTDEAQNFISNFDYLFQSVTRSARCASVALTQNINNYVAAIGKERTHALLGNYATHIFHANQDVATNQYGSELISTVRESVVSSQSSREKDDWNNVHTSTTSAQQDRLKVLPSAFGTLKKGGPKNSNCVEAIVTQSGRIWQATNDTYLRTMFRQQ